MIILVKLLSRMHVIRRPILSRQGPIITITLLIKIFRIGLVTGPRSAVLVRGRRLTTDTTDQGSVT